LPYKAHGPDGILHIVLQRCVDLILVRLTCIYRAIMDLNLYHDPWKEFTTIVLRKPGKPNYEIPKAHRPIPLISTMAKVLTAIIAENLSEVVEQHQQPPSEDAFWRTPRTVNDGRHAPLGG
jgi:hypothetical protein